MKKCCYLILLKRSFRLPHIFGLFFDNIFFFFWLYFYNSQNVTARLHLALEKRTNLYALIVDVPCNNITNLEIYLSSRIKPFFMRKERNIHNYVPRASYFLKMRWRRSWNIQISQERKELNKKYFWKQKLRLALYKKHWIILQDIYVYVILFYSIYNFVD